MAQIRLIGTDPSQVPTNGMLGNLAFQNAESVSLEKLVVTSTVGINGNVTTSSGSAISYGGGETYQIWNDDPESSAVDTNGQPAAFRTLKTFVASKSGSLKFKFSAYIQSGTYYWAWRIINQASTVLSSGYYNGGLDAGQVGYVHEYRRFVASVSNVTPGDILTLQMVSANSSGTPLTGNATGQILYAKEFRAYSTTPSIDHGGSSNVWGKNVGIGVHIPGSYNLPLPPITRLDVRGPNVANNVASLGSVPPATMYVGSSSGWGQNDGGSIALGGAADNSQFTATYAGIAGRRESVHGWEYGGYLTLSTVTIGTDQLSERVRINSIGHVGIGNNLPSTLLNVGSSTTANTTVRLNNSLTAGSDTGMYSFGLDIAGDLAGMKLNYGDRTAKGLQIFTSSGYGYPISFSTNGSQNMIIGSTGKILAGALTALNSASFQISTDSGASTSPYFAVFNTAASPTSAASTRLDLGFLSGAANYNATNTVLGAINWMGQGNDAGYGGAFIQGIVTSGGDIARASGHGVNLIFGTKPTNTAGSEERARIRADGTFEIKGAGVAGTSPALSVSGSAPANSLVLDSSGRVGLGTNLPASKLQVAQALQGNTVGTGAVMLMTTATATNDRLNINFNMTGSNDRSRAGIGAVALTANGYDCGLAFYTRLANDGTELATTDERMRIDSSGNVGICNVSPTYKLTIDKQGTSDWGAGLKRILSVDNNWVYSTFRTPYTVTTTTHPAGWYNIVKILSWDFNVGIHISFSGDFTADQVDIEAKSSWNAGLNNSNAGPHLRVNRTMAHNGNRLQQVRIGYDSIGNTYIQAYLNLTFGAAGAVKVAVVDKCSAWADTVVKAEPMLTTATSITVLNTVNLANTAGEYCNLNGVAGDFVWGTNATERLRITSTGTLNLVGAGAAGSTQAVSFSGSAPVDSLVVNSTGTVGCGAASFIRSPRLGVVGTNNLSNDQIVIAATNPGIVINCSESGTANRGAAIVFDHGDLVAAISSSRVNTNTWETDLRFYTHPSAYTSQYTLPERMRITGSGNVGIGTVDPSYKLDVRNGTIRASTGALAGAELGGHPSEETGFVKWAADNHHGIWFRGSVNSGGGTVTGGDVTTFREFGEFQFWTGGASMSLRMKITSDGHMLPGSDTSYDLGSTSLRWRNLYTTDLHLSNEGKPGGNQIDGTTGNWTIQEGEESLYIINNKSLKKYRFILEEIE